MAGWNTIARVRRLEAEVDKLGLKFKQPRNGDWEQQERSLALVPKDADALPIYSRDAELFVGTLEGLETWLQGVRWAREYDMMLKLSDEDKRARKEQDDRNRILLKTIKDSKIPERIKT